MSYLEQIEIIQAAMDGKIISGRRKGTDDWTTLDSRVMEREIFYGIRSQDALFNFQDFDYRIVTK